MLERLANKFNGVNEVAMHESVADESEVAYEENSRLGELGHLLTVGQK
jgi:hypothetical protein